jgi:hypothetical protein
MKMRFLFLTCISLLIGNSLIAQTPATEAGEDFDLFGVFGVFEESDDLEDFEKKLNSQENDVNNLDLNKDDEVDMIRLVEYEEGTTRLIVMQAVLGDNDYQDVATIELEKFADDNISCQIIGDEDMYGPDYIVEPSPEEASIVSSNSMAVVFVSVHLWTPVRFIFRPGRVLFVSAVIWHPRPIWFRPWRPIARATWRNRVMRWHSPRFRPGPVRHSPHGRNMYAKKRRTSPVARKHMGPKPGPKPGPAGPSPNQKKKQQKKKQQQHQR